MAVRVEYVTTHDSVRIAYARRGRGPTVLWMPPLPARHLELEWEQPDDRRWLQWLASRYTVVQYDPRGLGLSDRSVTSFTLDELLSDLEAVIERVSSGSVILFAKVNSGPLAIAYAARHPERVSHLVLWCSSPLVREGLGSHLDGLVALAERDWELFTQTAAHLVRGWSSASAPSAVTLIREALSPESVAPIVRDALPIDVTDQLSLVRAPTLVLQRRGITWVPMERAVELASTIPDARLVVLEGDSMALWAGGMSDVIQAFEEFLGTTERDEQPVLGPPDTFRCEGDFWTLAFGGHLCRVRDAKGLHHIARLLAHPGEYVPALDLLGSNGCNGQSKSPLDLAIPLNGVAGDAGPVLDGPARSSYRRRLEDLGARLAEAERFNDVGGVAAARTEMTFIQGQLAAAIGLGGRDRLASSDMERARLTVTKRIKGVLGHIERHHPALGDHLTSSPRTGVLCAYLPAPQQRPRWLFGRAGRGGGSGKAPGAFERGGGLGGALARPPVAAPREEHELAADPCRQPLG